MVQVITDHFANHGRYPTKEEYNAFIQAENLGGALDTEFCVKFRSNLWQRGLKEQIEEIRSKAQLKGIPFMAALAEDGDSLYANAVRLIIKSKDIRARETGNEVIQRQTMQVREDSRAQEANSRRKTLSRWIENQQAVQEDKTTFINEMRAAITTSQQRMQRLELLLTQQMETLQRVTEKLLEDD